MSLQNIPDEMKKYPNWVVWRYEERDGRKTKVPYNAVTKQHAKSNDSRTWNTFQQVETLPQWANGIGFMFSESPFVGIDIDHCIDGGKKQQWADNLADTLKTYTEVSPSGEGLHLIGKGYLDKGTRYGMVEMYDKGRYFTITGNLYHGHSCIKDIQADVTGLAAMLEASRQAKQNEKKEAATQQPAKAPVELPQGAADIIERIRRSRQAGLFSALYDRGDVALYGGDDSAADMALMNILPFWTGGNADLMLDIFNGSALAKREKWQKREDYRRFTVEKALKDWNGKSYTPTERTSKATQEFCQKENITADTNTLLDFALTDMGNAERLKHLFGDSILYVEDNGYWYSWTGKKWQQEASKEGLSVYEKVTTMARLSYAQAQDVYNQRIVAVSKEEEAHQKKVLNFFKRTENLQPARNCVSRAREICNAHMKQLDTDPYLFNCENGTVDLRTGELKPHNREDYITMMARGEYIPGAKHELWEYVLQSVLPDDGTRQWIQRFMGYCLFGLTSEEKFLFLYGKGGGGKGTFIESIGHVLGDYCGTMDIDTILTARNDAGDGGQPTPQLASLAGKRLVLTSESGAGRKFNSARIKLITGGDRITARFLHGNPFTFSPQFTLVMSSNYKPALTDTTDEGMRRRLVIVPFTAVIEKKDVMLKQNIKESPEVHSAILAWCIEGARQWWENGLGETPADILKAMGDYYADNDLIGQFIEECCVTGKNCRVRVKELLKAFNAWLNDSQQRPVTLRTFSEQIVNRGYPKTRLRDGNFFEGLEPHDGVPNMFQ